MSRLRAFIPGKVNNKTVIRIFEWMRKLPNMRERDFSSHLEENRTLFQNHSMNLKNGYIEDQNSYTDMKYGRFSLKHGGCQVIATFNALANIYGSSGESLEKLIHFYEKDGMVLSGRFGTSPKSLMRLAKRYGLHAEMSTKESDFNRIAMECDSTILTIYNDRSDIRKQVHVFNISKEDGRFTAHNVYGNGTVAGPFDSITEVIENINGGRAKAIALIGLKKK